MEVGSQGKNGTAAERVVWMTKTSDVVGSHTKTDLDAILTLIRRRIQEKCATTHELIKLIRCYKVSDGAAVTPGEFRFTLIKFGITLDQTVVNQVFQVFDSDKSGTMDFDEFAMWIMNSEFQPKVEAPVAKGYTAPPKPDSPKTINRKKFADVVKKHYSTFHSMKKTISFLELVSEVNRIAMNISERETRAIFQLVDPNDTGFVDTAALIRYAQTGRLDYRPPTAKEQKIDASMADYLIRRVAGRNTLALEKAFAHVKRGVRSKIPLDEFRRCLVNGGVGKNAKDVGFLYRALGTDTAGCGGVDVDLFFQLLPPLVQDARTEVSIRHGPTTLQAVSRADRSVRDSMRKSFNEVKARIALVDPKKTGIVGYGELYDILVTYCCPITKMDFRYIIEQTTDSKDGDVALRGVDYTHFLDVYNPTKAPHMLQGFATLKFDPTASIGISRGTRTATVKVPEQRIPVPISKAKVDEMKPIWQSALRSCHVADPKAVGQVSRKEFIHALETANSHGKMSAQAIARLADSYTLSNGLVNYLLCFRSYLGELTSQRTVKNLDRMKVKEEVTASQPTKHKLKPLPLSPMRGKDGSLLSLRSLQKSRTLYDTSSMTNEHARKRLLDQYGSKPELLAVCGRAYKAIAAHWRQIRNEIKRLIKGGETVKGVAPIAMFLQVLESEGLGLIFNKNDIGVLVRSFRSGSDSIRYDEFLQVCLVLKDGS